ncbi:MAG TPA: lipid-A-disaccharide synthase N-terminal domain-containing protein [Thermoanaerobaculia bacterium]|nr:lipid-A-disaccharide synthase N-terminal domain-containing protein [Thermoanaerobaculia bacterium]
MEHTDMFLQPWLGRYLPWFYASSYWWTAVGLLGNALFGSRFILQWLASERKRQIVVPPLFWHLSFWGSVVSLIYGLHVDKLPVILGYVALPLIYGRNLVLLKRSGRVEAHSSEEKLS